MIRRPLPTTTDARRSGRPINNQKIFRPGERRAPTGDVHGGGGPENQGARSEQFANVTLRQAQPSWRNEFENDFIGFAAPSTKPDVSGGGGYHSHRDLPANSFRALGDLYGGRQ
jgi:hypothetical protein